jgi:TRAP-type C4-dicarboxylate transport system permease large subunit
VGAVARESVVLTGGILMILGMTMAVTNHMIDAQVPSRIFEVVSRHVTSRVAFLAALNLFLLLVGCTMDIYAATVLVVPLILPVAAQFQVDPVHLGVIFLANLAIGYVTPPVGLSLFIGTVQFREPILKLYWVSVPFLLLLLLALAVITYVPELTLFALPR